MRAAWFGKWIISSRFEAHIAWPGLVSLVFVLLYFFGGLTVQSAIAPGFIDLPFPGGGRFGIIDCVSVFLLTWTLFLASGVLPGSRDSQPRALAVLILLYSLASLYFLATDTGAEARSAVTGMAFWQSMPMLDATPPTALVTGFSATVIFVLLPLVFGNRRHPVYTMLVPAQWMIPTVMVMFAAYLLAGKLNALGWGMLRGERGALGEDFSVFMVLVFQYMVLLFTAELRYLAAVRRAGPSIVRHV